MDVNELKLFIEKVANKDQSGDSMSPNDYNSFLLNANTQFFNDESEVYQANQKITDALSKFIIPTNIAKSAGAFPLPADYVHESSVGFMVDGKSRVVTMDTEDQLNYLENHPTKPPTEEYPYGTFKEGKIVVLPDSIQTIRLTYLRMPVTPVWGYTIVAQAPVYNPLTSTQIEFDPTYHLKIARIILSYMGIDFRDDELQAYAERQKAEA